MPFSDRIPAFLLDILYRLFHFLIWREVLMFCILSPFKLYWLIWSHMPITYLQQNLGKKVASDASLNVQQPALCMKIWEVGLICSICQFPWYRCFHCGQFQGINVTSTSLQRSSPKLVRASSRIPLALIFIPWSWRLALPEKKRARAEKVLL